MGIGGLGIGDWPIPNPQKFENSAFKKLKIKRIKLKYYNKFKKIFFEILFIFGIFLDNRININFCQLNFDSM